MKDFLYKKSWYTVIEIIVAIVISSFIILWLTGLLQKFNSEIFNIQSQTSTFSSLSNFQSDFNNYKFKYTKAINVVDNSSWYDVLLLMNTGSQRWIMVWVVDKTIGSPNYLKLDPVSNYNIFWDKVLWIKELTTTQTQNALSNSGSVYSIVFNDSNLYSDVKVDSFIINAYNSWSVMDISMDILTKFYSSYIWKDRASVVDSDSKYRVNISLTKDVGIYAWPYSCVWTLPSWTGAILSPFGSYSSWVTWSYLWTWVSSEAWILSACTRKCDTIWYEGNIWWIDSYTTLLLHWDWVNNSTTFTDSELTPKTVSVAGDTKISTTQTKFGGSSIYFDWAGDYLTLPNSNDWEFGSWDFTIDWWEYRTACGNRPAISRDSSTSYTPYLIGYCDGGSGYSQIYITSNWSSWDIASGKSLWITTLNTRNHFALVRKWTNFYVFKNGIQTTSWTSSLSIFANSNPLSIGRGQSSDFGGYIDELRISKWVARWTSNFTPPTVPFNALSTSMCRIDSSTTLLLHWDWANNSTTFTDSESTPKTVSVVGDTKISTTQTKFGGSSMYFDWAWDYLTLPNSSDWDFGSWDYTIDFWYYPISYSADTWWWYRRLLSNYDSSGNGFDISHNINGTISINRQTSNILNSSSVISTWVWNHISLVRFNGSLSLFINGVQNWVVTDTANYSSTLNLFIGRLGYADIWYLNWYLDELRISKWVARWTGNFTPPSIAY